MDSKIQLNQGDEVNIEYFQNQHEADISNLIVFVKNNAYYVTVGSTLPIQDLREIISRHLVFT